ncbi:hypothetical protein DM992_01760 [Burkholderia sp. JP2-270]|nr:hypothetical protein DM992_01760 [Burkholderia sp. JP2-270]
MPAILEQEGVVIEGQYAGYQPCTSRAGAFYAADNGLVGRWCWPARSDTAIAWEVSGIPCVRRVEIQTPMLNRSG